MDYRDELLKQVHQLLIVLRQILKSGGTTGPVQIGESDGRNITLNICIYEMLAGEDGDGDAWDAEWNDESEGVEALTFELTPRDEDFLKSNGLVF